MTSTPSTRSTPSTGDLLARLLADLSRRPSDAVSVLPLADEAGPGVVLAVADTAVAARRAVAVAGAVAGSVTARGDVVAALGVLDDVGRATPIGWREPGCNLYLLGATRHATRDATRDAVPDPPDDPAAEELLAAICRNASRDGLVDAGRALTGGGLARALADGCLSGGTGARVWLDELCERDGVPPDVVLLAESPARGVVAVPRSEEVRFADMCAARRIPFARIGVTDDGAGTAQGPVLDVQGGFTVSLDALRVARSAAASP